MSRVHFKFLFFSLYNWMLNFFNFYCIAHLYCTLYMFCIGLMMALLRPKHVALVQLIFHQCVDVHMLCFRR